MHILVSELQFLFRERDQMTGILLLFQFDLKKSEYLDSNCAVISPPREKHSYFSVILPDFVPTYICARTYLFCLCSFIKQSK